VLHDLNSFEQNIILLKSAQALLSIGFLWKSVVSS
jgi:hypothetical protein